MFKYCNAHTKFSESIRVYKNKIKLIATNIKSAYLHDVLLPQISKLHTATYALLNKYVVEVSEAKRFMCESLVKAGASPENAELHADVLIFADKRGILTHGMNRLGMYLRDLKNGMTNGKAQPCIVEDSPACALVDGKYGLGGAAGSICMNIAIIKAQKQGVGVVVSKHNCHYGACSYYTNMAINCKLIGITACNTSPLVAPCRAKKAALGTNPFSIGAPGPDSKAHFILDMATSTVSYGKLQVYEIKGLSIPEGWSQDENGQALTDPSTAMDCGHLLPLGGTEETGGYKGYGMCAMVEVLCGVLSGGDYGLNIYKWKNETRKGKKQNLSFFFMALNPKVFITKFESRLKCFEDMLKQLEPINPDRPVLMPGDIERENECKVEKQGGIEYLKPLIQQCDKIAKELKIKPLAKKMTE